MKSNILQLGGIFTFDQIRDGDIIDSWQSKNIVVNEGLNYILNAALSGLTPLTSFYIGLFSGNTAVSATTTAANVVANYTEITAYDEATRQLWVDAGPSSQVITNLASPATFTINATVSAYGAFLVSASAKSATTGTLIALSQFTNTPRALIDNDILNVTYTLTASSS